MITGKILGKQYIINGIAADVSDFNPGMSADIYYEVVRMIDGKYLFLQDHIERLRHSLSGSGIDLPNARSITESLRLLQLGNDFTLGNIRICIQKKPGEDTDLLCYFIPYLYPEICTYKSGVQLVTYPHERPNPGIKKWDDRFRSSVSAYIRDHGVYEAVLMNGHKQITEGSRSNIFFLNDDNRIITPPEKSVLPGITRKHVFAICAEEGIEILERPILLDELDEMTSCFISGTSPKILPIWQLDGFQFAVDHPVLALLMDRFETLVKENLVSLVREDSK